MGRSDYPDLAPRANPTQLAMRHERIPIEQKLANDAQCRPATPAFEGALMGTARSSGNGKHQRSL